jgi:DNA-binding CsgD family transcriptional regulator/PAS domain-containing protein
LGRETAVPLFRNDPDETTSALIAAIYDAAINPAKWQFFVNALNRDLHGIEPVFYLADTKRAIIDTLLVSDAWGDAFLDPYMAHYNALNPWTSSLATAPAVGQPISGDQIIADGQFKKTEFYGDFFRNWGGSAVIGVVPFRDTGAFSVLGLHCSRRTLGREQTEIARLAARLSPHITRAFEISRQLQHGAAARASLELLLKRLVDPALVVSADLCVRYANRAAEELFRTRILLLDPLGRIAVGSGERETKCLQGALRASLKSIVRNAGPPQAVSLSRSAEADGSNTPLLARIMPWGGGIDRSAEVSGPVPPIAAELEVLVLISDPAAGIHIRSHRLRELFGLTTAEARLAQAMARGTSLQGFAAAAGVSEGTARVQLKSVFSKTSTHRQAELVALLARVADPIRPML